MLLQWWTISGQALTALLDQHGLLAAFLFLLVDEAGVPTPVPGNLLIVVMGVEAQRGQVSVWQAVLVLEVATVAGATFLYGASAWAGRALVYRYGRFMRLTPERLRRSERWLQRHGFAAVVAARLIPGMRIATAVACGVLAVPFRTFLPAMSLGALVYIVVCVLLGYIIGPPVLTFFEQLHLPLGPFK